MIPLSKSQRALLAAELATLSGGGRRLDQADVPTVAQAACRFAVSPRSVGDARRVLQAGDPWLIGQVRQGRIAVSVAAAALREGRPPAPPTARTPPTPRAQPAFCVCWTEQQHEDRWHVLWCGSVHYGTEEASVCRHALEAWDTPIRISAVGPEGQVWHQGALVLWVPVARLPRQLARRAA